MSASTSEWVHMTSEEQWAHAQELEAENERLREALEEAIYHADNLQRVRDGLVVRDLDESRHGLEHARAALRVDDSSAR